MAAGAGADGAASTSRSQHFFRHCRKHHVRNTTGLREAYARQQAWLRALEEELNRKHQEVRLCATHRTWSPVVLSHAQRNQSAKILTEI